MAVADVPTTGDEIMSSRVNWRAGARCRTADAEQLFVTGARQREVRDFCRTCPVRTECLAHALDQRIEFGVWGGMTERERRALLRSRPDVTSWTELLFAARDAHAGAGHRVEGGCTVSLGIRRRTGAPARTEHRTHARSA